MDPSSSAATILSSNTMSSQTSTDRYSINNLARKLYLEEFQSQCNVSIPAILGLVFYKIPWMISLHFVGSLGAESLAAAALATTLCNVTGMSISVGLSSAIVTLTGQARGHLIRKGHDKRRQQQEQQCNQEFQANGDGIIHNYTDVVVVDDDEEEYGFTSSIQVTQTMPMTNATHYMNHERNDIVEEKKNESTPLLSSLLSSEQIHNYDDSDWKTFSNETQIGTGIRTSQISTQGSNQEDSSPLLPLVFLYRGIFIQLLIVIPIGLWWIHGIEPLLLYLNQAEKLSAMTTIYLRILTPGLWSYSINWTMTAWLQSIEMADVPAYAAFVGFVFHIPFNILYVDILGYGYEGVAMATVSFQIIQPLLILFYLFGTKRGRDRILLNTGAKAIGRENLSFWPELYMAISSLSGTKQYLELGLPGMIAISEWWASEFCIFLAGTLEPNPDYALGAMSIYQSINAFCFMFPMGFATAGSSRVGLFLGKNQPTQAQLASKTSVSLAMLMSLTMGSILYFTPHTTFPSLFTSDFDVILQTSYTIPLLAFYVVADGLQIAIQGTIKGCGKQFIVAPIVVFSYWVIGVPLAYYKAFVVNDGIMECDAISLCGVRGLIFGLLIGTWLHMLLLLIVVVFTIDWRKEAVMAQGRMSLKQFG